MKMWSLIGLFILIGLPSVTHAWLSGYTNFANVTVNGGVNDSFFLNLSSVGVTCGTPKCLEVVVTNKNDGVLPFNTAVNGLWYGRTAAGENISGTYPKDNVTAIRLNESAVYIYVYYNNNTEQVSRSEITGLLLLDDNFQEYGVGSAVTQVAKFFSNNGGAVTVDNSGSTTKHALGMNGGGFTVAWNVTQYKDVTWVWELNNSASASNDQFFFTFGTTSGNYYRSPYTFANNVWDLRKQDNTLLGTSISFTGSGSTGINISAQRDGNNMNIYLRTQSVLMKGGNVSDTSYTTNSLGGWVNGLTRKGLLRLTVWNSSVNPAFSPAISFTTNTLVTNTCTPTAGSWSLNLADNCTLSGTYSVTNWTIYSTGRGRTVTDNFTLSFTNRNYGSFVEFVYLILVRNTTLIRK